MSVALSRPGGARLLRAWVELTKPAIVMLVVLTGAPALLLSAGGYPPARVFWGGLFGTVFAAASAACFNMYFDRDIDAIMKRTAGRPLPAGVLPPSAATGLGFVLAGASWVTLVLCTNLLAAVIAQVSILYYAVLYTLWLKRRTPQNIVIGGGAGASAPLIAWAAVTGHVGLPAFLLAGVVFLWTPPHFWSLALVRRDDYIRAGIPMLPVTHGEAETRRQILIYSLVLVPITLAVGPLAGMGWIYLIAAALLGAAFLTRAVTLYRRPGAPVALGLFRFSILYLFLLFLAMTADVVVGSWLRAR